MPNPHRPILLAAAFLMAAAFGVSPARAVLSPNTPAPAWALKNLAGKTVTSGQYKGKVVILDFWATWCGPCQAEIPGLVDLYHKFAAKGLVVVGASVDNEGPSVVKDFVHHYSVDYPIVMADDRAVSAFGDIDAIPSTFVIDRKGVIVAVHVGFTDESDFEKAIKPLL